MTADDTTTTATETDDASETEDTTEDEQKSEDDKQANGQREVIPPRVAAALKKANAEAEKYRLALKKFEDRDKSEIQRAADERDEARKEAEKARTAYMRLKVGATKGLPLSLAERLQGETEDEMSDDADALLADMKQQPNTNGKAPSFEAGARKPAPKAVSMNDLIRGRNRR